MDDRLYYPLLLSLAILALGACSHASQEITQAGIDGLETFQVDDEGLRHGLYRRHQDDILIETATYRHGLLHGLRTLYDQKGTKEIEESYELGQFVGTYRTFHPNGQVDLEGTYTAGRMEGIWVRYYSDGTLREEVALEDNEENGPFSEYHPNGKLKAKGHYQDGPQEHGELTLYDEEGRLIKKMNCTFGICHTTWSLDE